MKSTLKIFAVGILLAIGARTANAQSQTTVTATTAAVTFTGTFVAGDTIIAQLSCGN